MKKGKVSLPKYGVRRRKMIPRKNSRPLVFVRDVRDVPNAGKLIRKENKTVFETKEEKFTPETKNFEDIPIKELTEKIGGFSDKDLKILLKDYRKGAKRLAEEEIAKRES